MTRFKIYQENCSDITVVSNLFIDEYMKDANDAQLKIYLYLLRVMGAGLSTSVSDIADQFNHTEKDVVRALKYWEKNRLLALEYDEAKNLSGIRLLNVSKRSANDVVALAPVVQLPSKQEAPRQETLNVKSEFCKPSYSLDQLKEFQNKEETAQLLFVAEQYIGKPLSPSEIKTILFFADRLNFSEDLIDYLIQYCVDKGKKDFRYIEKVAISWAQEGITTPKQAAKFAVKYEKSVYDVMKALGKSGIPTKAEADYILKWNKTYGFTKDIILEACSRTVMATDNHRFEYADSILSSWHQKQVHHKSDIKALDEAYAKSRAITPKPRNKNLDQFNQFMHSEYDFEELEKEILSN
ncbi:DnaD domain protein [Parablautia muri]|uniref:DnaD domain protein n=1 Tax=Parablautia muri TaxID=2320879 RepID=A0A9X5BEL4_9FIRM|nr:DnaD domain protein [Parablautia muri]NBJ91912.1 DnaD domain protein [Parablautia muri]